MREAEVVPHREREVVASLTIAILEVLEATDEPWAMQATALTAALTLHAAKCARRPTVNDQTELQGQVISAVEQWIESHGGRGKPSRN